MIGDVWLFRQHRAPGFRGWLAERLAMLITLIKAAYKRR